VCSIVVVKGQVRLEVMESNITKYNFCFVKTI
jgi:hypothetical protein